MDSNNDEPTDDRMKQLEENERKREQAEAKREGLRTRAVSSR
jgi:hypothetical protein